MDSQLYIVINANLLLGQIISKRLAQKGNNVVYLADNEQDGYAIAADEPRVRYRHCFPFVHSKIAEEFKWVTRNVAPVNGIIVLVSEKSIDQLTMPLEESFFAALSYDISQADCELTLTYVIVPDNDKETSHSLEDLHLKLCQLSHKNNTKDKGIKVNHIVISCYQYTQGEKCVEIATNASDLIHYLSSKSANAVRHQAFYFSNSED
ncbi:hypothetical protein [Grimontia marina]|uniref:Short chain dehydrogenase n=1 Tax=Grimontia marina TaxID=646534 RepID=A0A128EY17_9GAMM|nr:hypothetical protein [Grimontia marina]CZF79407.1 hypothetical protein GMA8713_00959 [Grimontia marina]